MTLLNKVLVFTEDVTAWPELCSGGRQLAKDLVAIIVGSPAAAEAAAQCGAKSYWLGEKATGAMLEDYTDPMAQIIAEEKPNLILVKATTRGRVIAGRLSVILKAGVVANAMEFEVENETTVKITHLVYGGTSLRTERPLTEMAIALVGSGVFAAAAAPAPGELIVIDAVIPAGKITCREVRPKEGESIDLGMAKRVIGVGRGMAKQADLAMVQELAVAIGAEMACTRPIAEGENWMARSRYIGVSGAMIKPEIYLAIGISGQVQHMVGVNTAKTIIAINQDKNAPIFRQADYGIVGDLYKIVPEIIKLVRN